MPQRVVSVKEADHGERIDICVNDPTQQSGGDEEMRTDHAKQISETFGPILNAMKLAGEYFGEATFTKDANQRRFYLSRYYNALAVLGQWLVAFIAVTSHIYEGYSSSAGFFTLLVTTTWYVQCASITTICFLMLPLTFHRQSRLAQFLSSFLKTGSDLAGLRPKALRGLMIACAMSVINSVVIILVSIYFNGIVSVHKPWDHHLAIRVIEILFGILNSFAWTLPLLLFCVTCLVLETKFETLKRKANSYTIAHLRQEYLKLCGVVDLANRVFSALMFVVFALDIPLICINVYQLIKRARKQSREEGEVILLFGYLYWSACFSCFIAVLCMFGHRVNDKVCFFDEFLVHFHEMSVVSEYACDAT